MAQCGGHPALTMPTPRAAGGRSVAPRSDAPFQTIVWEMRLCSAPGIPGCFLLPLCPQGHPGRVCCASAVLPWTSREPCVGRAVDGVWLLLSRRWTPRTGHRAQLALRVYRVYVLRSGWLCPCLPTCEHTLPARRRGPAPGRAAGGPGAFGPAARALQPRRLRFPRRRPCWRDGVPGRCCLPLAWLLVRHLAEARGPRGATGSAVGAQPRHDAPWGIPATWDTDGETCCHFPCGAACHTGTWVSGTRDGVSGAAPPTARPAAQLAAP